MELFSLNFSSNNLLFNNLLWQILNEVFCTINVENNNNNQKLNDI